MKSHRILCSLIYLAACNPSTESICDDRLDNEGDGLVDCADPDCGHDSACQGGDTGTPTPDADGDGYGSEASGGDDCDDDEPAIHPGATEVCDGIDNDCDGDLDDDDPGVTDQRTWYLDSDADGYGQTTASVLRCAAPTGYVSLHQDCDDDDATTYPGAAPSDSATDCLTDRDGDGYGSTTPEPGVDEGTDCADDDARFYPGAVSDHWGMAMAYLCPGTFTMGSPSGEVGRDSYETQHEVTLTGGFSLGVYEVTQVEFEVFMGYQPAYFDGCADCPAEYMTWHEAAAFTNRVSWAVGLEECYACSGTEGAVVCDMDTAYATPYDCAGYRLPTEAEWEYAARAGTESAFSNGGNLVTGDGYDCDGGEVLDNGTNLDELGVYCGNDLGQPSEVGTKDPNPWGLYDMHGNVWEWCHDWWDLADYPGDATDPWGDVSGSYRVLRGGAWNGNPRYLRSAYRHRADPGYADDDLGFRLARSE